MRTQEQQQLKAATAILVAAIVGLATAVVVGFALVPRVRLVEVVTVLATAVGGGAALAVAITHFRQARAAAREARRHAQPRTPRQRR